ncbi:hypothetical protein BY458DRAFT_472941 [Sporodiniella umbellata]|nr:hypothetical protein BY458DRAFT_472941 [Sporodiniella umbellata]
MSAFNNDIQPTRDDRLGSGQLNENHGIAATGLNDPFTSANAVRTSQSNDPTSLGGQEHSHAPGLHNPAEGNRTAGTGIPPVSQAGHATAGEPEIASHVHNKHGQGHPEISSHVNNKHGLSANQGDHGASHHQQAPTHAVDQHTAHSTEHPTTVDELNRKPSVGEKIKGTLEKAAGKITGDEAKVVKGDNLAHGRTA